MEKKRCLKGCLKENKNKCHSKLDLESHHFLKRTQGETLNQVQGDGLICYNDNDRAFTLIELLVVVLIIGILAAVAVPQYKLAVAKTRMTQLVTMTNSTMQAEDRYYLANGDYTLDWDELDISFEGVKSGAVINHASGWRLELHKQSQGNGKPNSVYATDSRLPGILLIGGYLHHATANQSQKMSGIRSCYAGPTDNFANALCQRVAGKKEPDETGGNNIYRF